MMEWVNHHQKSLILHMYFLCFRFCLLFCKLETVVHGLWDKQHAIHFFRNLKTAYCKVTIHARSSNTKISQCFCISLRTVQRIPKELEESNSDYECTTARKPHSNHSEKRTPKYVDEIQTMIDNNPRELIRSIATDKGVSAFLIRMIGWLFGFYGISTLVGYLMPNPFLHK